MTPKAALWRIALAAVVSALLLIVISNAIRQPIQSTTRTYHADFTDVSGLSDGADVRVRGVRVGKVQSIALKRTDDGRSIATVQLTLDNRFDIVPASRLAVKYQALTGLRYVDVQNPAQGDAASQRVTHVPTTQTQPSFDITTLFNGLQPVLAALSPDEINRFTDNAMSFLQGDGDGLEPMLNSIHKLTALVSDRQQVVSTLVRNLAALSDGVRDRSQFLTQIADELDYPLNEFNSVLDELRKMQISGRDFSRAVLRLLAAAGIRPGVDPNAALDRAFDNTYRAIEALKRTPVIWDNIPPPPEDGAPVACSHGRAQLPEVMDVLLNGQRVVLCEK